MALGYLDIAFTIGLWLYIYYFAFEQKFELLFNTLQLNLYQGLAILHNAFYLLLSVQVFVYSNKKGGRNIFKWVFYIIALIFVSWFILYLAELYVYPSTLSNIYYYPLWVIVIALNLYLGFNIILQPSKLKFDGNIISHTDAIDSVVHQRLISLMETENLYRKQGLRLSFVAGKLDITASQLSQIIKHAHNKSFYEFINSYRINDVIERFKKGETASFTIKALAEKAGFRSKTTFTKVFKKKTGLLPKEFLNQLQP